MIMTGCGITMTDLEYMEELDDATNMQAIISKLPYKLREKCRNVVFDIPEKNKCKTEFKYIVELVSKKAKVALHSLIGDIRDVLIRH